MKQNFKRALKIGVVLLFGFFGRLYDIFLDALRMCKIQKIQSIMSVFHRSEESVSTVFKDSDDEFVERRFHRGVGIVDLKMVKTS